MVAIPSQISAEPTNLAKRLALSIGGSVAGSLLANAAGNAVVRKAIGNVARSSFLGTVVASSLSALMAGHTEYQAQKNYDGVIKVGDIVATAFVSGLTSGAFVWAQAAKHFGKFALHPFKKLTSFANLIAFSDDMHFGSRALVNGGMGLIARVSATTLNPSETYSAKEYGVGFLLDVFLGETIGQSLKLLHRQSLRLNKHPATTTHQLSLATPTSHTLPSSIWLMAADKSREGIATAPSAVANASSHEVKLRQLLQPDRIAELLQARQQTKSLDQRLLQSADAKTRSFSTHITTAKDLEGTNSVFLRHASLLRWLQDHADSPFKNRKRDLKVWGIGAGAVVAQTLPKGARSMEEVVRSGRPFGHKLIVCEPFEVWASLSRKGGHVIYDDLNTRVVQTASRVRTSLRYLTTRLKGNDGAIDKMTNPNSPQRRQLSLMGIRDASGTVAAGKPDMIWLASQLQKASLHTKQRPAGTVLLDRAEEYKLPAFIKKQLTIRHQDILLPKTKLPQESMDVVLALNSLTYVKPPELHAFATLLAARGVKKGGVIATGNVKAAWHLQTLGFQPLTTVHANQPNGAAVAVLQRPNHDLPLLGELIAAVEKVIS